MLYINNIKETFLDFPDDESLALIVFFEGCSHGCSGCQNPELQRRNIEESSNWGDVFELIENRCKRSHTNKIVFSGGDPFFKGNLDDLEDMFKLISSLEDANYKVCVYTGYSLEQVYLLYDTYGIRQELFPLGLGHSTPINIRYYMPSYLKCGVYNEHLLNPDMGKSNDSFILASSNQNFYKKLEKDSYEYKCISTDGILRFR